MQKDNTKNNSATAPDAKPKKISNKAYEAELVRLQIELVKLQEWVKHTGHRVAIVFEGRDAAGKGGTIKRITEALNPRTRASVDSAKSARSGSMILV